MKLCFFRHGIAIDREDPSCPREEDRFLTAEGMTKTRLAAQGLRWIKMRFDVVLTSPWLRAAQTAAILTDVLKLPAAESLPELAGDRDAADLIRALAARTEEGNLLLVGHEPLLSETAVKLLGGRWSLDLRKSGACAIEVDGLPAKSATLLWHLTSRQLRGLSER